MLSVWTLLCLNSWNVYNNNHFFDLIRYRDSLSSFSIEHWVWKIHYQSIFKFQHKPVNFFVSGFSLLSLSVRLTCQRIFLNFQSLYICLCMRETKGFLNSRHNYFAHIPATIDIHNNNKVTKKPCVWLLFSLCYSTDERALFVYSVHWNR